MRYAMVVGVCHLDLRVQGGSSLKGKRQVMKSLLGRVRSRFNVSISEVGNQDNWNRAEVGICLVGNDKDFIDSALAKVISFIEGTELVEVIRSEVELLSFNPAFFR